MAEDDDEDDDGEFRACVEFISELPPDLYGRIDPENQLLLFALSQVRETGDVDVRINHQPGNLYLFLWGLNSAAQSLSG